MNVSGENLCNAGPMWRCLSHFSSACHAFCRMSSLVSCFSPTADCRPCALLLLPVSPHSCHPLCCIFRATWSCAVVTVQANWILCMCDTCHQATGLITPSSETLPLWWCVIKVWYRFVHMASRELNEERSCQKTGSFLSLLNLKLLIFADPQSQLFWTQNCNGHYLRPLLLVWIGCSRPCSKNNTSDMSPLKVPEK